MDSTFNPRSKRVSFLAPETSLAKQNQFKRSMSSKSGDIASTLKIIKSKTQRRRSVMFSNDSPNIPTAEQILQDNGQRVKSGPEMVGRNKYMGECKSEVEKHLNYNLIPPKTTQKKIDYLITPYNQSKIINKFMSFQDEFETFDLGAEKWNKISKFILNKDKYTLRDHLMCIDSKLYVKAKRMTKGSKDNYVDLKDLQEINSKLFINNSITL